MKRLLLIPLLALPLIAQPVPTVNVTGTARVGAIWPHDLTFEWHMESTTAEFSVGDSEALLVSEGVLTNTLAYDGTYSLYCPSSGDRGQFDVAANDLGHPDHGTVTLYAYMKALTSGATLWVLYANSSNQITVAVYGTSGQVRLNHFGNSTVSVKATTTGNVLTTGVWHRITAKWQRDVSPYLSIDVDGAVDTQTTTNLTEMGSALTSMAIGDRNGIAIDAHLDNLRVYKTVK